MKKPIHVKPLIVVLCFMVLAPSAFASHYMGGEITWECTPQGNFRFIMKVYRECQGINYGASTTLNTNVPGFPGISMTRISTTDISPKCSCPGGPVISCSPAPSIANTGAIQAHVYTSDNSYPNGVPLTGTPPATGWYFGYTSCCRNPSSNITGMPSWYLRAWMFPYNNTPINTCFDNSPVFADGPSPVLCTSGPGSYLLQATDPDGDSIRFEWGQPLNNSINTPITNYLPGYSFSSPLPSAAHNPNNIAASLDPNHGMIHFTSYTNGAFVTVIKVTSYRNGIKISEIFREMQMVLLPCGGNNAPVLQISPAFTQIAPQHYHTTAMAGDSIQFSLIITDPDTCPGTLQPNNITFYAYGDMFGSPINPGGCTALPCATLYPSPAGNTPLVMQGTLSTTFHWQTSANHLWDGSAFLTNKTFTFLMIYHDDHCPVPGNGRILITVDLQFPFLIKSTEILCARVIPNGDVQLNWEPNAMPGYAFNKYEIMSATNPQGPYSIVSSIANLTASTFTHTGAGANIQPRHYYINTELHTPVALSIPSTTNFTPIFLTVTPQTAATTRVILTWNHTHPASPTGTPRLYEVFRDDGNGVWQLIGHTYFTTYNDYMPFLNQTVRYRIETPLTDPSGTILVCRSISNVAPVFLSALEDPTNQAKSPIIFPNPNHGTFMLDPGDLEGDATISIVATNGSIIHQFKSTLIRNQPCSIEVSGLAAGNYLIHIESEHGEYSLRMKNEK